MDGELSPRARLNVAVLAAMEAACAAPARWGGDDCALWCANVLKDALGYDAAATFRGCYADRPGARAALGGLGLGFALRAAARAHGWRQIAPQSADTGDIGLTIVAGQPGPTTLICRAPGWFIARTEHPGFAALPAKDVRLAWAVL